MCHLNVATSCIRVHVKSQFGCGRIVKCIETADVIKCHVTPTLTLMHLLSCSDLFC